MKIANAIENHGVENFRRLPLALSYFVPTYGPPTLGINAEQVQLLESTFQERYPNGRKAKLALSAYLSGRLNALADYRVLMAANKDADAFGLTTFSESNVGNPIEQFDFDGRRYSRSSLNYLLGLSLLKRYADLSKIKTVLEIGGGFGTLGEIIGKAPTEGIRYIDIDIPPINFVADYYLRTCFGSQRVLSGMDPSETNPIHINSLPQISVMCSWQLEYLVGEIDLFVNFISFQEMEPLVVANYIEKVSKLRPKFLLLRNLREGKRKRCGEASGVEIPILGSDYQNILSRYRMIASETRIFGYETVDGFHSEISLYAS
jgi:putative sugar O-methyltransferase